MVANIDNLNKMADYIETIPQEEFDMERYRSAYILSHLATAKCDTVGCIIGHCTAIDSGDLPIDMRGRIDFNLWSENFTGLGRHSVEWKFLFHCKWQSIDNTPIGAAKRIRYFIKNGLPENWLDILYGKDPIPY